jgi:hypothetical protein
MAEIEARIPATQHPADERYEINLGAPGSDLRDAPLTARLDRPGGKTLKLPGF